MANSRNRRWAQFGVVGPSAFIAAWVLGGARAVDYSPIDDAISRLAAVGAPTRPLMTAGFVVFGVSLCSFGYLGHRDLGKRAAVCAIVTGTSTLGVALMPLDHSSLVDTLHAGFALIGYLSLIALPVAAIAPLKEIGLTPIVRFAPHVSIVAALCLLASTQTDTNGMWQRAGLTTIDLWIIALSVLLVGGKAKAR